MYLFCFMIKKKRIIKSAQNYNYLLDQQPEGFVFKPACGTRSDDGIITVSGMEFPENEIDTYGAHMDNLVQVFSEIQEKMEKENATPQVVIGSSTEKSKPKKFSGVKLPSVS